MNKLVKIILIAIIIICALVWVSSKYLFIFNFVDNKSPEVCKNNWEYQNKKLLEAEARNGSDYWKITLLDSNYIQINVGNNVGGVILTKNYKISNDTISIIGGIADAEQYINSSELIIQKDEILFLKSKQGNLDTINTLKVNFNKLKK